MGDQFTVWCTPEYGYTSTFRRRRSIDWTKRMSAQARLFAASPEMVEMLCALVESTDAIPLSHTTLVSTPTDEEPKWRWQ